MAAHAKRTAKSRASRSTTPPSRRWSAKVTTDSTHPDKGLFLKSASEIARGLASKRVSPKGPASGMRMLNFYINRAGKNLSASRRHTLERAKELLSERIALDKAKSDSTTKQSPSRANHSPRSRSRHRSHRSHSR